MVLHPMLLMFKQSTIKAIIVSISVVLSTLTDLSVVLSSDVATMLTVAEVYLAFELERNPHQLMTLLECLGMVPELDSPQL